MENTGGRGRVAVAVAFKLCCIRGNSANLFEILFATCLDVVRGFIFIFIFSYLS